MKWFYQTSAGQPSGPVDSRDLRRLADAGIVRPETLVRKGASGRWVRAEKVQRLFQRSTPTPSLGATLCNLHNVIDGAAVARSLPRFQHGSGSDTTPPKSRAAVSGDRRTRREGTRRQVRCDAS
ncbi:MAG: DUF4339 domain-containing protein [Pirellulaceae bacterium]